MKIFHGLIIGFNKLKVSEEYKIYITEYSITTTVLIDTQVKQEVKVIPQKAPHSGPIPRLGVTPGGRKLYH